MRTKEELPACPVATTVSLIGSKWKLLILRNLRIRSWRFNELKQDLDGISQKVLTDSLRSLEKDGIIVLDFKTDHVTESTVAGAAEHYRLQVQTYAEALSRIYEMPVKAKYLYFFQLERFVEV